MTQADSAALYVRRRRTLYRATHRGTSENDMLIGAFVARRIASFTTSELTDLEALLDLPEPDLADWLTGRRPVPPEADSPMLRRMRAAAIPAPLAGLGCEADQG